jgi:large subunit ribosomal protein L21
MGYAIIKVGGKQHRVTAGEWLYVDRLALDEGATFNPEVLLIGGDGETDLAPTAEVTARILAHTRGEKIRIGKYRRRKGYRRHNGFRASLTKIQIETIGAAVAAKPKAVKKVAAAVEAPAEETREAENGA